MANARLPRRGSTRGGSLRRRAGMPAAGAAILALAVAACATVPTSGAPQLARGNTGQPQVYPQLIALGPGPKWNPKQIVLGFLHASATFTNDHAIARSYLTPAMRRQWHPGWAATVVAGQPRLSPSAQLKNIKVPPGSQHVTITLTGHRLATVSDNGQYNPALGAGAFRFVLVRSDGLWRIDRLPPGRSLLLYESDFDRVYQPHNLYFFTPNGQWLVPDPVFVPQQATNADLATGLVKALLAKRQGWLTGATSTRFPAGTTLLGQVKINGSGAIVDLGGAAAKASAVVRHEMAAQLVSTLASSAYTPSAIQSVQMQINGVASTATAGTAGTAAAYRRMLPPQPAGKPYYLGDGGTSVLSVGSSRPVASLAYPLSAVAVAPGDGQLAGISVAGKKVCTVYSGPAGRAVRFVRRQIDGGSCSSLSWDSRGEIFTAAGDTVWMLPPGKAGAVPVVTNLVAAQTVTDLRVAPDGVRVAMLIRNPNGTSEMAIGALVRNGVQLSITHELPVGAGITDPAQLAWYGPYDLLVLSHPGRHARLSEVPVNGSEPTRVQAAPGTVSIATDGTALAAGTDLGRIWESAGPNLPWQPAATGYSPVYPG
jgi:Lipoprotein LpqB beta-propeller domain